MEPLRTGDPDGVGDYRLLGRLGAGGMGEVFLGVSPGGRKVAVKLIHPVHAGAPQFRERFAREVDAARRVGGFHTAHVVDADPHADPPWMVTAYIEGPSLQEAIGQGGPLPPAEVRALGAGLAEGLAAIHARGLVHRDLKPSNVILATDGPRVIDFGIARALDASTSITATGALVGTIAFMSPEQISGEVAGPASDVFSLGGVLAFAATGRPPFGSDSTVSIMFRAVNKPPDLARVTDGKLREVIAACLAKSPGSRPPVREILAALSPVPTPNAARAPAHAGPPAADNGLSTQSRVSAPRKAKPAHEATHGSRSRRTGVVQTGAPPAGPAGSRSDGRSRGPSGSRSRRRPAILAVAAVVIGTLGVVLPLVLRTGPPAGTGHPPAADPTVSSPATTPDLSSSGSATASESVQPSTPHPITVLVHSDILVTPLGGGRSTGVQVRRGEKVRINATGRVLYGYEGINCPGYPSTDPAGDRTSSITGRPCGEKFDSNPNIPAPRAPVGSLLWRVADSGWFEAGTSSIITVPENGTLYLAVNDDTPQDNTGFFTVTLTQGS